MFQSGSLMASDTHDKLHLHDQFDHVCWQLFTSLNKKYYEVKTTQYFIFSCYWYIIIIDYWLGLSASVFHTPGVKVASSLVNRCQYNVTGDVVMWPADMLHVGVTAPQISGYIHTHNDYIHVDFNNISISTIEIEYTLRHSAENANLVF